MKSLLLILLILPFNSFGLAQNKYFNEYILKAVDSLYRDYKLKGYDTAGVLTHTIPYSTQGILKPNKQGRTMCVAAQMEVILIAMQIYLQEHPNSSAYNYLPKQSWEGLSKNDIKGHLWVNPNFGSYGGADALRNFGMGENIPFEKLLPGSLINFNRTTNSGHAVIFISFIDSTGTEFRAYNPSVVGFKYLSSQGLLSPQSGIDFKYAVFSKFKCPTTIINPDCNVVYSQNQKLFNTGMMWSPENWQISTAQETIESLSGFDLQDSVFDELFYNGQ